MRERYAKLHHPDLRRLDRPRCDAWAMAGLEQVATGRDSVSSRHLGAFKMQILIVGIGALGGGWPASLVQARLHGRLQDPC